MNLVHIAKQMQIGRLHDKNNGTGNCVTRNCQQLLSTTWIQNKKVQVTGLHNSAKLCTSKSHKYKYCDKNILQKAQWDRNEFGMVQAITNNQKGCVVSEKHNIK